MWNNSGSLFVKKLRTSDFPDAGSASSNNVSKISAISVSYELYST